jgi:hypothetical protein
MIKGMLHQLCLGPMREPDKVDTLGESRIFSTATLEVLATISSNQAHTEIVSHSPEIGNKVNILTRKNICSLRGMNVKML